MIGRAWFEPWTTGWEVRLLPLRYSVPPATRGGRHCSCCADHWAIISYRIRFIWTLHRWLKLGKRGKIDLCPDKKFPQKFSKDQRLTKKYRSFDIDADTDVNINVDVDADADGNEANQHLIVLTPTPINWSKPNKASVFCRRLVFGKKKKAGT